jgi:glycosyltransferase involved in cell wall biosynthesis
MNAPSAVPRAKLPVSVFIIARDEEVNLPDCLHSVSGWADQIVVVLDPRTTDRTRDIALAFDCEVVENLFEGYSQQRNWALDHAGFRHEWVFVFDADERVSPQLRREIARVIADPDASAAYAARKRFIFYGRWIKHCWYGPWTTSLFRKGKARWERREVHEHLIVDGEVGYLHGDIIHNDFKDMDAWIQKHNRYATLEAAEVLRNERDSRLSGRWFGSRVERRRWMKDRLWNRLPLRPLWLFFYLYVVRLGFLDGALGFRFCVMHAIFDAFTTTKVWESRWTASHPARNYYRDLLAKELAAQPHEHAFYRECDS